VHFHFVKTVSWITVCILFVCSSITPFASRARVLPLHFLLLLFIFSAEFWLQTIFNFNAFPLSLSCSCCPLCLAETVALDSASTSTATATATAVAVMFLLLGIFILGICFLVGTRVEKEGYIEGRDCLLYLLIIVYF